MLWKSSTVSGELEESDKIGFKREHLKNWRCEENGYTERVRGMPCIYQSQLSINMCRFVGNNLEDRTKLGMTDTIRRLKTCPCHCIYSASVVFL